MTDSLLLNITLLLYLGSLFIFIAYQLLRTEFLSSIALTLFFSGALTNLATIILRGVIANRVPFSNTYETLVLFAFLMVIIYLAISFKTDKNKTLLTGNIIFIILLIALASFFINDPKPLVPALKSNWLTIHVLFCIISYSAFAVGFIRALIFIVFKEYKMSEEKFEIINRIIITGYTFLILGITTGSIWGEAAWGSYWNWDPKETWSLITFLIYTIYFHLKTSNKLETKYLSIIIIIGFCFILFTYFGVNYLLTGLHSYT